LHFAGNHSILPKLEREWSKNGANVVNGVAKDLEKLDTAHMKEDALLHIVRSIAITVRPQSHLAHKISTTLKMQRPRHWPIYRRYS
jgi:hypothetical protein